KQLPPTRFFAGTGSADLDDEESEQEGGEIYESILDECTTIGLPDTMLRWHYRSRREELIAFSNQHFYENNLVTFPGPFVPRALGAPVQSTLNGAVSYEKVDGVYIRSKGRDARTNPIEAQVVATRVLEHFETSPHQSLGVIAFNEAQATAIQIAITQGLRTKPHLETHFAEGIEDAFFVKNLENVQGDERDVILFSIGYGRDQNGKLSMNFGPLNRAGGERRLNVAVTRARLQVHLITSLDPADIDPSRTSARGPALLRSYLEFAKNGCEALPRSIDDASFSTLKEIVAQSLEAHGWKVQRSVGFSDMRIDLAVQDPTHNGEFLLGIECDGPDYTRAHTARDRDRLRHQVLSGLGWQLERVWSPDWIKNPDAQLQRLLAVLRDTQAARAARPKAAMPIITPPATSPTPVSHATNVLASNAPQNAPTSGAASSLNTDSVWATQDLSNTVATNTPNAAMPRDVMVYTPFTLPILGAPDQFYALAQTRPGAIVNVVCQVVDHEGPIHLQAATRRVIAGWNMSKAGAKLVGIVEYAAQRAARDKRLKRSDDFLWPFDMKQPPVRVPRDGEAPRPISEICLEEIAEAAWLNIRDCFGLEREELVLQTARLLGYKQTGAVVRTRIEAALERLTSDARVKVVGDSFALNDHT
ncbi:MAG: hypothetical protein JWN98_1509, partial [Abditibacteriota bacterium]|nr:hypothetical protein [Abditibacteriota bacterium]